MRNLILKMNVTIDGFVGGPKGEIDWLFRSLGANRDDGTRWVVDTLWQAGVHIMGSRTYADMAAYWPSATDDIAAPMNGIPKVVFSRTGKASTTRALEDASRLAPVEKADASWGQPRVASGDLAEEIARLKAEPGKSIRPTGGPASPAASSRRGSSTSTSSSCTPWRSGAGFRSSPSCRSPCRSPSSARRASRAAPPGRCFDPRDDAGNESVDGGCSGGDAASD